MISDDEFLFIQRMEQEKRRRQEEEEDQALDDYHLQKSKNFDNSFTDVAKIMGHRKYRDDDNDYANDYDEQALGIHDAQNRHRPLRGLTTPGAAYTGAGGVVIPYSHDMVSLKLRPRTTNGGHNRVYKMPEPKAMQLSINFGDPDQHNHHLHTMKTRKINQPELFRLDENRIRKVNGSSVLTKMQDSAKKVSKKQSDFSKRFGSPGKLQKVGRKETDDLSLHLVNFAKGQQSKKKKSFGLSFGQLNFEIVGIGTKKRKGGSS